MQFFNQMFCQLISNYNFNAAYCAALACLRTYIVSSVSYMCYHDY